MADVAVSGVLTRRCSKCQIVKPVTEWYKRKRSATYCKTCDKANAKAWYHANKDRARSSHQLWSRTDQGRTSRRQSTLKYRYGLSEDDYGRLLDLQGGACAICGIKPDVNEHLHVDHDHLCCPGRRSCGDCLRGLLCGPCNRTVGAVEQRPGLISYIELGGPA